MRFCDFQIGVTLSSTERAVAVDDINSAFDPILQARQVFQRRDVPHIPKCSIALAKPQRSSASQSSATHACCGRTLSGFVWKKWGGKAESLRTAHADYQYLLCLRKTPVLFEALNMSSDCLHRSSRSSLVDDHKSCQRLKQVYSDAPDRILTVRLFVL